MNPVKQWLFLEPLDTLFFRGSDQMVAGENHEITSMFPPMPATIIGAIRTAILNQRGIDPHSFNRTSSVDPSITQMFPLLGTPECPGFEICGPLFVVGSKDEKLVWFVPAPAHWFSDLSALGSDSGKPGTAELIVARPMPEHAVKLGLCGTVKAPLMLESPSSSSYKSLSGWWTTIGTLQKFRGKVSGRLTVVSDKKSAGGDEAKCLRDLRAYLYETLGEDNTLVVPLAALAVSEQRMGIGLEVRTRRVKEGHLYGTVHFRLRPGVRLAIGLSEDLVPSHLEPSGTLTLGGERRIVRYEILDRRLPWVQKDSTWLMALNPFPVRMLQSLGWRDRPRFSGSLLRVAGWDMGKRFHKETTSFMPAGTVFCSKVDDKLPFGFIRI